MVSSLGRPEWSKTPLTQARFWVPSKKVLAELVTYFRVACSSGFTFIMASTPALGCSSTLLSWLRQDAYGHAKFAPLWFGLVYHHIMLALERFVD